MKRVFSVVLVLLMLTAALTYARLGETVEQCDARYGKPIKTGKAVVCPSGELRVYKAKNIGVGIEWLSTNKTASAICFRKIEENALGIPEELSSDQIETLLDASSQGHKWTKKDLISIDEQWMRDDGAEAQYTTMGHVLVIFTPEAKQAIEEASKKQKQKEVEGF